MIPLQKLYRSRTDRIIFGVAGGLGKYFQIDPTLVRIAFVVLFFANGVGLILYLVMAAIVPNDPTEMPPSKGKDVRSSSAALNERVSELAHEFRESGPWKSRHNVFGVLLVVLGILLLVGQVMPMYVVPWELIWPLLLVFVGVYFLFRKRSE